MTRPTPRILIAATMMVALSMPLFAASDEPLDVTPQFAGLPAVHQLRAVEIAGVLILRGKVADRAAAEAVSARASALGYQRVANLIQTVDHDDVRLVQEAERELSIHRALDGCHFTVASNDGVVSVAGTVRLELQKDVALQVLRSIDGVQRVEMALQRF